MLRLRWREQTGHSTHLGYGCLEGALGDGGLVDTHDGDDHDEHVVSRRIFSEVQHHLHPVSVVNVQRLHRTCQSNRRGEAHSCLVWLRMVCLLPSEGTQHKIFPEKFSNSRLNSESSLGTFHGDILPVGAEPEPQNQVSA